MVDKMEASLSKGGSLAIVRPNDLTAGVLRKLIERNVSQESTTIDSKNFRITIQSGGPNLDGAKNTLLTQGLPAEQSGSAVNRLYNSRLHSL